MTAQTNDVMLERALNYASAWGIPVFPLKPGQKEPATRHGVNDATTDPERIRKMWDAHPNANIGGRMGGGYVAIDVDGEDGADWLASWERDSGKLPETATSVTGGGGAHYVYRTDAAYRPSVNSDAHIDIRGEGSYIVLPPSVHPSGAEYFWDLDPDDVGFADADETVRALISDVQPAKRAPKSVQQQQQPSSDETIREGGRNAALYAKACSMRSAGLTQSAITAALYVYNRDACKPPLEDAEVRRIAESAGKHPAGHSEEVRSQEAARGKLKPTDHIAVGEAVIDEKSVCFIDGIPAARNGDIFTIGWGAVDKAIMDVCRGIKQAQRREVRSWLAQNMPTRKRSPYRLIGFTNGVFDMDVAELRPYEPTDVLLNQIPHEYDKDADCPEFDHFIDRISCGDASTHDNIQEVMGLCIMATAVFGVCPVLIGEGSNGKSTFIEVIKNMLGRANISALQPSDIGRRFQGGMLVGKLANLGDDISNNFLDGDDCAQIKKVATGNEIYTDVKGEVGYTFAPYCTMVFSANEFPRLGDTSDGMLRRLHPILFQARFSPTDKDYNPDIAEILSSREAMARAIIHALIGAENIRINKRMTPNEKSTAILSTIKEDNNSVIAWMAENEVTRDRLERQSVTEMYERYKDWCDAARMKSFAQVKFTRTINALHGFKSATVRDALGKPYRAFINADGL